MVYSDSKKVMIFCTFPTKMLTFVLSAPKSPLVEKMFDTLYFHK